MTLWNSRRVASFDSLRYLDGSVLRSLSFEQFSSLPLDERVKVLLVGKPRFFRGHVEIPKTQALARRD